VGGAGAEKGRYLRTSSGSWLLPSYLAARIDPGPLYNHSRLTRLTTVAIGASTLSQQLSGRINSLDSLEDQLGGHPGGPFSRCLPRCS
jgi:hypothetical protein